MPEPYYEHGSVTIYHGDWRDVLPGLDLEGAVVVSDPPYGTGGWRRTEASQGSNPSAKLVKEDWDDGAVDWLTEAAKATATLTFWPGNRALPLLSAATALGLVKHRMLCMRKRDPKPQPAGRIRWSLEPVWCLSRDGYLLYGETDWWEASTPREGRDADALGHPYQKPLEVMRWLVGKTREECVVDPFMGSGTTIRAAKDLGRTAIGIELEERYCEMAARRLGQEVLDLGEVA